MAVTRLGTFTPWSNVYTSQVPPAFVVPAGGIPVGARIVMAGAYSFTGAYDSKGNTYTVQGAMAASTGAGSYRITIADCLVTTALVAGDTINPGTAQVMFGSILCWWQSASYLKGILGRDFDGTAVSAPPVKTLSGDYLAGLVYCCQGSVGFPAPGLGSAGSGYTKETGVVVNAPADGHWDVLDWMTKPVVASGIETPNGVGNKVSFPQWAITTLYSETPPAYASIIGVSTNALFTSTTMPAHQPGDLILLAARTASATPPTIPLSTPVWQSVASASNASVSLLVCAFIATTNGHISGIWQTPNAAGIAVVVVRPAPGRALSIGAAASANGVANTATFPAVTLQGASGSSVGLRFIAAVAGPDITGNSGNWLRLTNIPAAATTCIIASKQIDLLDPAQAGQGSLGVTATWASATVEVRSDPPNQMMGVV